MTQIKNAIKNVGRNKVRNIFTGLVVVILVALSTVAMLIDQTTLTMKQQYQAKYGSEVTVVPDFEKINALESQGGIAMLPTVTRQVHDEISKSDTLEKTKISSTMYFLSDVLKTDKLNVETFEETNSVQPVAMVQAFNHLDDYDAFNEKKITLVDGRMGSKAFEVVISEHFAEVNDLNLGDTIVSKDVVGQEDYEFEVVGIYRNNLPTDESYQMMDYVSQNSLMYTPYETVQKVQEIDGQTDRGYESFYSSYTYYLKHPEDLNKLQADAKTAGLSDLLKLATDEYTYQQMVTPLERLSQSSMTALLIVLGSSLLVLGIIELWNLNQRKKTFVVLRRYGMKQGRIYRDILVESILVVTLAMGLGLAIGLSMGKPAIQELLNKQVPVEAGGGLSFGDMSVSVTIGDALRLTTASDIEIDNTLHQQSLIKIGLIGMGAVILISSVGLITLVKSHPMESLEKELKHD